MSTRAATVPESVDTADYVVIGGGINGLVAAAELGRAGHSVIVLERAGRVGGFIGSGERTVPGFVHDTFSSWHPLFVSGAAYGELGAELHSLGLEYRNTDDAVTASIDDGGTVAIAYRDVEKTVAAFEFDDDRDAYRQMLATMGARADTVFGALGSELRSRSALALGLKTLRRERLRGVDALAHDAVMSGRAYLRSTFRGSETDRLWAPWLLHAGLGPDHATGGVMLPVMALSMHGFGLPVVAGGAGRFVTAFERMLERHGVRIVTGASVDRIVVDGARAVGARVGSRTFHARRAVLASVTPQALYTELLPEGTVEPAVRSQAQKFRYGRGAMQIHVALDAQVPWSDRRLADVPLVHVTNGAASTGIACAEAEAGLIPWAATIVVGQQSLLDPSRAPEGKATLWLQLQEVPYRPLGDAGGSLDTSAGWTPQLARGYADRIIARLDRLAPGLEASVEGVDVIAPTDLEAANPNAVQGDPYGGSAELDQNLLWRPLLSASRHRTAVEGLWHIGSSTHPGPGLGGGSGHLVAQSLLRSRK